MFEVTVWIRLVCWDGVFIENLKFVKKNENQGINWRKIIIEI